jgi:hypothetical protein
MIRGIVRSIARGVLAALIVAACGVSSVISTASLTAYAAGQWTCISSFRVPGLPTATSTATATVTVTNATSGRVKIVTAFPLVTPSRLPPIQGEWRLQGEKLSVAWDDKTMGTTTAQPISLDATRFQLRAAQPDPWVPISVSRHARSVTFSSPGPNKTPVVFTCNKH